MKQLLGAIAVAVMALALTRASASAHAEFITSSPAPDSTVSEVPAQVSIVFSALISRSSTLVVTGPSGAVVSGLIQVDKNNAAVDIQADGPGVYQVAWTNTSLEDGHDANGAFQFTVAGASDAASAARGPVVAAGSPVAAGATSSSASAQRPPAAQLVPAQAAAALPAAGTGPAIGAAGSPRALFAGATGVVVLGLALARRWRVEQ